MEQGKHLSPEGNPYKRLAGKRKGSDQPMTRSNAGVGQGNGQPMIENRVTLAPSKIRMDEDRSPYHAGPDARRRPSAIPG
jgi:hypothetical protein